MAQQPKSTLYDVFVSISKILSTSKLLSNYHDPNFQLHLIFDINMNFVRYLYERGQPQHYKSFFGIHQTNMDFLVKAEFEITRIISTDAILTKQGQDRLSRMVGIIQKIILEKVPVESPEWIKLVKTFPELKNYTSSIQESWV